MNDSSPDMRQAATRLPAMLAGLWRDVVAGVLAAVVLAANIVSFGTLMFPGPLAAGAPVAVWAMLVGSGVGGLWIALRTSLPPLACGIDSPTGAVLVLLAGSTSAAVLAGDTQATESAVQAAVQTTLLAFTGATVVTGLLMLALGVTRRAAALRFVPHFVVAGFMAATGFLLVAGGVRMTTGHSLTASGLASTWTGAELTRLGCAAGTLALLLALRRWARSPIVLPLALLGLCAAANFGLRRLLPAELAAGWYPPPLGALPTWSPWTSLPALPDTGAALRLLPELLAAAVVALVSLVTKVSTIEATRRRVADFNRECSAHGVACLIVAPIGGVASALQTGISQLLEQAGAVPRRSGAACALVLAAMAAADLDLLSLVPVPLLAGLVFFLGWTFLADAAQRPLRQRAWLDLALAALMASVCLRLGYLWGVLGGVVVACLMFAVSYARIGVVRRHATAATRASYVSRSPETARRLRALGPAIQMYELGGYLFFGSSESLLERVRTDLDAVTASAATSAKAGAAPVVSWVLLDFAGVTGADTSAGLSLAKLSHLCRQQGATLLCSAVPPALQKTLAGDGVLQGPGPSGGFEALNPALAWCEDRLLERDGQPPGAGGANFDAWLAQQIGPQPATGLMRHLERREIAAGQPLYLPGEPSDTVDVMASGRLAIELPGHGGNLRVRILEPHSLVGEIGFFRGTPRTAGVVAVEPTTLYSLSRQAYARLREQAPETAAAVDDFMLNVLAERVSMADQSLLALAGPPPLPISPRYRRPCASRSAPAAAASTCGRREGRRRRPGRGR